MVSAYAAFFLSGATALLFEGFWLRQMTLVLGSSPAAFALVSSSVILGLGVGTFLYFRGIASRGRHPFRAPATVLGTYSTVNMLVLYKGFAGVLTLLLCSLLSGLAVASFVSAWSRTGDGTPNRNGMLFGVHFLGGSIGVVAGGFFLIPGLGVRKSVLAAFLTGLLAVILCELAGRSRMRRSAGEDPEPGEIRSERGKRTILPAALVAGTGWTGFGMEILWGRWISQMAGSSVYTYFSILAIAISAFGAGCLTGSRIRDRNPGHANGRVGALFAICAVLYPVLALCGLLLLEGTGFALFHLFGLFRMTLQASILVMTFLLLFPPLFGSGAFFSLILDGGASPVPPDFRACFLSNCVGAVVAGVAVPFLLVPSAGMGGTLVLLCFGNAVTVFLLLTRPGETGEIRRFRPAAPLLALAILLLSGFFLFRRPVYFLLPQTLRGLRGGIGTVPREVPETEHPAYYREGSFSTVLVGTDEGNRVLIVDGKPESNAVRDRATQTMLAHLPFLVRGEVFDKVLLIGLGSGATLGGILSHPVGQVDCAEISAGVVDSVRQGFGADDGNAIRDPRVHVTVEDGRRYLRKKRGPYDLIVSQPSNPWVLGASSLFTRDAFLEMASALTSSGVAVVWFQTYGTDPGDFSLEVDTIRSVFPHVVAFSYTPGDVIFLCSSEPVRLDLQAIAQRISALPAVKGQLLAAGIGNAIDMLGGFFGEPRGKEIAVQSGETGVRWNTDDRPVLEYALARSIALRDPYPPYSAILSSLEDVVRHFVAHPSAPSDISGSFLLDWGESACRRGFCRFAEERFLAASREVGMNARILNNLGIVRFDRNDYNGAKRYFLEALSVDPQFGPARENLERLTGGGYGTDQEMDRGR